MIVEGCLNVGKNALRDFQIVIKIMRRLPTLILLFYLIRNLIEQLFENRKETIWHV